MNFEACLSLPRDPREAALIADNLDALARALRSWPADAWGKLGAGTQDSSTPVGLFERLALRTAEAGLDAPQRKRALESAEAAAGVLRVLWPETASGESPALARRDELVASA
jgi:hypothetical protein